MPDATLFFTSHRPRREIGWKNQKLLNYSMLQNLLIKGLKLRAKHPLFHSISYTVIKVCGKGDISPSRAELGTMQSDFGVARPAGGTH
jgi:hypothetical protein